MSSIIPDTKINAVKKALQSVFHTDTADDIQIVSGGLSSALVYKIQVDGRDYLMRITMVLNELTDPHRQFTCMNLAAEYGISPRVYYTNHADALSITDFIIARPVQETFAILRDPARFAALIKSIHSLPLFPGLLSFLDGVDGLIKMFKESNMFPDGFGYEAFELYTKIQKAYPRNDLDLVSSHNDLNPNNILFDGEKIWVIDWEASYSNDRYVDLAIAAQTYPDNTEKEEILLKAYFDERLNDYKRARFFLMQQVCYMYYAMLMFKVAAAQADAADCYVPGPENIKTLGEFRMMLGNGKVSLGTFSGKLEYGKVLFDTLFRNMKTDKLDWSVRIIEKVSS